MTEQRFRLSIANIPINVPQGVTYYQRWQMRYKDTLLPFPFFSTPGVLLWKGRCMFRVAYADAVPVLSLTTEGGGVIIDYVDDASSGLRSVFYSLIVTATQAAALPPGKILYDIEFERLSDGWVIRPQKGRVTTGAEVTK